MSPILATGVVVCGLCFVWNLLLVKRARSWRALEWPDYACMVITGLTFCVSIGLAVIPG